MKRLIVEGWRSSCHSYALVNQYQLLQLLGDQRFEVLHRDVPFYRPDWAGTDSGLTTSAKRTLASIAPAAAGLDADLTYRISYPYRVHEGAGRVFVFATSEIVGTVKDRMVGADGRPESIQPETVRIVTPSSWSRDGLLACGFAAERVHVVPHGIDPSLFGALPRGVLQGLRRELGIDDAAFVFLNVGAMTWNKGIDVLLLAFARHHRAYPRSTLLLKGGDALYGKGPIEHAVRQVAEALGSAAGRDWIASIRYVGHNLSRPHLAGLMQLCDAYVSPYRAEGFNLPVLEAMACARPVIVTEGGATEDFCPDGLALKIASHRASRQLGEYLEPSIDSTVEQMARVVDDPVTRERLAAGGRSWALSRYSWAAVTDQLAHLLDAA